MRARGDHLGRDVVRQGEGVREVDVRALRDTIEERARAAAGREVELVPAHVGHLEARGLQARGGARHDTQARGPRAVVRLAPALKEELEAQADAQERHPPAQRGENRLAGSGFVGGAGTMRETRSPAARAFSYVRGRRTSDRLFALTTKAYIPTFLGVHIISYLYFPYNRNYLNK